jgi:hypothetical protein
MGRRNWLPLSKGFPASTILKRRYDGPQVRQTKTAEVKGQQTAHEKSTNDASFRQSID